MCACRDFHLTVRVRWGIMLLCEVILTVADRINAVVSVRSVQGERFMDLDVNVLHTEGAPAQFQSRNGLLATRECRQELDGDSSAKVSSKNDVLLAVSVPSGTDRS